MMDCVQFQEYLSEYLEGELPPGISRDMDAHSSSCPMCAYKIANLKQVCALLGNLSRIRTSTSFEEKLKSRIYSELNGGGRSAAASYRHFLNVKNITGVGVAAALVAGVVFIQKSSSTPGGFIQSSAIQQSKAAGNNPHSDRIVSPGNDADYKTAVRENATGHTDSTAERFSEENRKLYETVKYSNE